MCPSLIEMRSKTAEKSSPQTNRQTDRHYENNGHLAVNQKDKTQWKAFKISHCSISLKTRQGQ